MVVLDRRGAGRAPGTGVEVDAAREGGFAVDDQGLAVVAQVEVQLAAEEVGLRPAGQGEVGDGAVAVEEAAPQGVRGAEAVVEDAAADAGAGALGHGVEEFAPDGVVADDERLEVDVAARGADGVEHRREGFVAGQQGRGFVARQQREGFGEGREGAVEFAGAFVVRRRGGAEGAPVGVGEDFGGGVPAQAVEAVAAALGAAPALARDAVDAEHRVEDGAQERQGPRQAQPEKGRVGAPPVPEEVQRDRQEEGAVDDRHAERGPADPVPVGKGPGHGAARWEWMVAARRRAPSWSGWVPSGRRRRVQG